MGSVSTACRLTIKGKKYEGFGERKEAAVGIRRIRRMDFYRVRLETKRRAIGSVDRIVDPGNGDRMRGLEVHLSGPLGVRWDR